MVLGYFFMEESMPKTMQDFDKDMELSIQLITDRVNDTFNRLMERDIFQALMLIEALQDLLETYPD